MAALRSSRTRNTHKSLLLGASKRLSVTLHILCCDVFRKIHKAESLVLFPKMFFGKGKFEMDQQWAKISGSSVGFFRKRLSNSN